MNAVFCKVPRAKSDIIDGLAKCGAARVYEAKGLKYI